MKRFVLAALAAALLVPGASLARAQDEGPGPEHAGPPPEMNEKMAAKMKEKLGLSDDQSAKLKDAMKAHRDAMKPLMDKTRGLLKKLHDQVEAKASDADVKATLDSLKDSHKAVAAEQESFHEKVAGFLSPTQQAKLVLGMFRRMHEMGGRMRGRMNGRRGPGGGEEGGAPPKDGGDKDDGSDD